MPSVTENARPMGYLLLEQRHGLRVLPHHVLSYVVSGAKRFEHFDYQQRAYYPDVYWPGETDWEHLEFALKHEGLNLPLLRALLPLLDTTEFERYVRERPTGQYRRRLWYLYEQFTGRRLNVPDIDTANNVELLDPQLYYAGKPIRSSRHRVLNNLPGTIAFSPMVRRTATLNGFENDRLEEQCKKLIAEIPSEVYSRALDFLYAKETKSSYAIERETPDRQRAQKFVAVLREAAQTDSLEEKALVTLQNTIVDPRFKNDAWRSDQNYVGRSMASGDEEVHFISPKPQDIKTLMDDYLTASRRILESDIHPVVAAAMIAFPFVFLHPFGDGNGRCHRFLIHYTLAKRGFAPEGVVFPVSAIMLHRLAEYDRSLESFSKPALSLIEYTMDRQARVKVVNETIDLYRYIDCTFIAETLFSFVKETIHNELPSEIRYLQQYDRARESMGEIVDMPNRNADLFIRYCRQNGGKLGKDRRKQSEYVMLTAEEIAKLEAAVREAFDMNSKG
jgi:hypothetical protein